MSTESNRAVYKRRGAEGTLRLHGVVDIFEAATLHSTAQKALQDEKAKVIRVDFTDAERLDVSAMQILLSLKQSLLFEGRTLHSENISEGISHTLRMLGLDCNQIT